MFNSNRCYVYNKAMHEASPFQKHKEKLYSHQDQFQLIREWAKERGLYDKGNATTQYVKLQEEAGELAKALLKNDQPEVCLLYTSPSPRDGLLSRMPSSA